MKKRMELQQYISLLEEQQLIKEAFWEKGALSQKVEYISYDSQDIKEGTLFVCKGAHFLPKYLVDALEKGAFCYVAEKVYEEAGEAPCIIVTDIRRAMALLADVFYDKIWKDITTIGITGTKGKSSTTYFVKSVLDEYLLANEKAESGVLSSIDNYDGVIREESHLTTPEAMMLHRHFQNAVDNKIDYMTMEVSSQALKYHRTLGITFDIGCFMNLGEDHISPVEHPTLEDYMESKMILMRQCETAVINKDSQYAQWAIDSATGHAKRILTFGESEGVDVQGYDIQPTTYGLAFRAKGKDFDEAFEIGLKGLFNISNALAAITICHHLDVPMEYIVSGLAKARVSGRMEVFTNPSKTITAIVDYAHNKMSFEALFDSVKEEFPGSPIIICFGCPGKKAQRRRLELGESAGTHADLVILTEEDAGEEPVHDICLEIAGHVKDVGGKYEIIDDRGEAIKRAVEVAAEGTVILLTGKGRETRQKRGIQYIDTPSDVDYVQEFLAKK